MNFSPSSRILAKHLLLVTSLTLGSSLFIGCSPSDEPEAKSEQTQQRNTPEDPKKLSLRNEEQWIVEEVIREIASLASFAGDPEAKPLGRDDLTIKRLRLSPPQYAVTIKAEQPLTLTIDLGSPEQSIWSPARYRAVATALLEQFGVQRQEGGESANPQADQTELLLALAHPTSDRLEQENRRLSAHLTAHPLDARAYEQAALLITVLGLRENSGIFWDTRGICNRATAALVFAEALRGGAEPSDAGTLAELGIGLLSDTTAANEKTILGLQAVAKERPSLAPWVRIASLRNSRDWRFVEDADGGSLLERMEYFRAVADSGNPEAALRKLKALEPHDFPDWGRILFQYRFSVSVGHLVFEHALALEFRDIVGIFPEIKDEKLNAQRLAQLLNRAPTGWVSAEGEGKAGIQVIDRGTWAHYFQRHLCHMTLQGYHFLKDKWGVPDQARQFRAGVSELMGGLTLFPLVQVARFETPPRPESELALKTLMTEHPEWVPDAAWAACIKHATSLPSLRAWLSSGLPVGTAYNFEARIGSIADVGNLRMSEIAQQYALAPHQSLVAKRYLWQKTNGSATPEQFREVMGNLVDYNLYAMRDYAKLVEGDPKAYAEALGKVAEIDPYYYIRLSRYFADRGMKPEAAAAFESAIKNDADAVAVANTSEWLINYYYDEGRKDEALALAQRAAEVYSASGLEAMARLSERMGNMPVAEEHYLKIQERYNSSGPLYLFYERQSKADPQSDYSGKMKALLGDVFPNGMKEAAVADFSGAPKSGVIINEENKLLRKNGMKRGDIITALDGRRVDSFEQYSFVRSLTETDAMELIVYQNGAYRAIKASAPDRRFGCDFDTYSNENSR